MEGDDDKEPDGIVPANDNDGANGEPSAETWQRIDRAALTAANDNHRPVDSGKTEDEADKEKGSSS